MKLLNELKKELLKTIIRTGQKTTTRKEIDELAKEKLRKQGYTDEKEIDDIMQKSRKDFDAFMNS